MSNILKTTPLRIKILGVVLIVATITGAILLRPEQMQRVLEPQDDPFASKLKTYGESTKSTDNSSVQPSQDGSVLNPCSGNPQDDCLYSPSIDFYPGGAEGATNPTYSENGETKDIMGRIQAIDNKTLDLKTSSGRVFSVTFPIDAINDFNTNRSANYDGLTVGMNDMITVTYVEPYNQSTTKVSPTQIFASRVILKDTDNKRTGITQKY